MKLLKITFILLVFFTTTNCSDDKKTETTEKLIVLKDTINSAKKDTEHIEGKINALIMALPEVEKASTYIDSLTKHKHGATAMIDKPTATQPDYCVSVGYNGDDRFEVYYFFYVNPTTLTVKIEDIINDTIIPIDVWRKNQKLKATK